MPTRERDLWATLRTALRPYGKIERLENALREGWPDCVYSFKGHAGFIELKHVKEWPKRQHTCLIVRHLTGGQVLELEEWARAGIGAYMLLQVANDYMLLRSATVRPLFEGLLDQYQLKRAAAVYLQGKIEALPLLHEFMKIKERLTPT